MSLCPRCGLAVQLQPPNHATGGMMHSRCARLPRPPVKRKKKGKR